MKIAFGSMCKNFNFPSLGSQGDLLRLFAGYSRIQATPTSYLRIKCDNTYNALRTVFVTV